MFLDTLLGMGYSGYAILNNIPILLLPSGTPENEHLIMAEGAFNPDPSQNANQLVAYQRRSFNVSFQTIVSPRTWPLVKALTYGWRDGTLVNGVPKIDMVPEVSFTYVLASGEGFQGTCHVDDLTLSAAPDQFLTMGITVTSWDWTELLSPDPLSRMGTPVLSPLLDPLYKPIAGWNCPIITSVISSSAILQRYSLKFVNNWTYQTFLAGYSFAPNPGLIAAGNLDVTLDIGWVAARKDRPLNSGTFQFYINGADPGSALDIIYIDYMGRGSRNFDGGGSPNQVIQWNAAYFCEGPVPRSS